MQVTHPRALDGEMPAIAVDVNGERAVLDDDGTFVVGDDDEQWVRDFAAAHNVEPDEIIVREEDKPPDGAPIADPPLNPADFSVAELRNALRDADYSDAELDAIADAEAASKDRTTAHDAIDAARSD